MAVDEKAPGRRRPLVWQRFGWWVFVAVWPAVAVALFVAWLLWDRAEPDAAWGVGAGAGILFFALWSAMRARARAAGRRVVVALRGLVISLLVVGALVAIAWFVLAR